MLQIQSHLRLCDAAARRKLMPGSPSLLPAIIHCKREDNVPRSSTITSLIYPVHQQQTEREHDIKQKDVEHAALQNFAAAMQHLRAGPKQIVGIFKIGFDLFLRSLLLFNHGRKRAE
jgi:hypothetical protein